MSWSFQISQKMELLKDIDYDELESKATEAIRIAKNEIKEKNITIPEKTDEVNYSELFKTGK